VCTPTPNIRVISTIADIIRRIASLSTITDIPTDIRAISGQYPARNGGGYSVSEADIARIFGLGGGYYDGYSKNCG
jgi:hypothetical protein